MTLAGDIECLDAKGSLLFVFGGYVKVTFVGLDVLLPGEPGNMFMSCINTFTSKLEHVSIHFVVMMSREVLDPGWS